MTTPRDRAAELIRHYAELAGIDPDEAETLLDCILEAAREQRRQDAPDGINR